MWDKASICAQMVDYLHQHLGQPVREHDLIRHLDSSNYFSAYCHESSHLQLFRKHFITRHCLYSLQEDLSPQWQLQINTLGACLMPAKPGASAQLDIAHAGVGSYYLDLENFHQASDASVHDLLQGFWQRYTAVDASERALTTLGVAATASWREIQGAYRRKAQRAHPDQGGSAAAFAEVQEAYEILKKHFKKT